MGHKETSGVVSRRARLTRIGLSGESGIFLSAISVRRSHAKRPNRERENFVGEQSRIVNRMKAAWIRLGIRGFNPKLKKAAERLDGLRTPEGESIPPNTWLSCVATWRGRPGLTGSPDESGRKTPRERADPFPQCSSETRRNRIGVAISQLPEGQSNLP
jgi:hypothetical protein